jgi:hypothetical protein
VLGRETAAPPEAGAGLSAERFCRIDAKRTTSRALWWRRDRHPCKASVSPDAPETPPRSASERQRRDYPNGPTRSVIVRGRRLGCPAETLAHRAQGQRADRNRRKLLPTEAAPSVVVGRCREILRDP